MCDKPYISLNDVMGTYRNWRNKKKSIAKKVGKIQLFKLSN